MGLSALDKTIRTAILITFDKIEESQMRFVSLPKKALAVLLSASLQMAPASGLFQAVAASPAPKGITGSFGSFLFPLPPQAGQWNSAFAQFSQWLKTDKGRIWLEGFPSLQSLSGYNPAQEEYVRALSSAIEYLPKNFHKKLDQIASLPDTKLPEVMRTLAKAGTDAAPTVKKKILESRVFIWINQAGLEDIDELKKLSRQLKSLALYGGWAEEVFCKAETKRLNLLVEKTVRSWPEAAPSDAQNLPAVHQAQGLLKSSKFSEPKERFSDAQVPPLKTPVAKFSFDNPIAGAMESLHAAVKDDYLVSVLAKKEGGRHHFVVLLGEVHVKNKKNAELGRNVAKQFDYIGVEGHDSSRLIGGRFFGRIHSIARKLMRKFSARTEGSTIDEIAKMQSLDQAKRKFAKSMESLSAKERERVKSNLQVKIGGRPFTSEEMEDFWKDVESFMGNPSKSGSKTEASQSQTVFDLEEGHKPDFIEQAAVMFLPVLLGVYMVSWITAFLPDSPVVREIRSITVPPIIFLVVYSLFGDLLKRRFQDSRWYRVLFPDGLVIGRNKTMAANISKNLEARPEMDKMLVVVGKAHVPGMKELLINQHGFKEIPVEW